MNLFKVAEKIQNNLENHKLIFAKKDRGDVVFKETNPKIKDDSEHFPINNVNQARNALQRANQYSKEPKWYDGTLSELINAIVSAVHNKFPSINISDKSKKPGKG